MIVCGHCGHQNRSGAAFCTFCGTVLPEEGNTVGRLIVLGEVPREYLLGEVERTVGRDPANDFVIDDGEVSGRHARIVFEDNAFWVEDLDSRNGTHVNGRAVEARTRLENEDLLRLGSTMVKFQI